jgi:sodium-dependent dicarboxylate transporter 2/3/5
MGIRFSKFVQVTGSRKPRWLTHANVNRVGLLSGPIVFTTVLLLPRPDGLTVEGHRTVAVTLLMAVWWVTEAIPISVTALVPLLLFPVLGVLRMTQTAAAYADTTVFLFLGGFMLAMSMQKWGLQVRMGNAVLARLGASPKRLLLGLMAGSALISMWVSNTATAVMMLPVALAVLSRLGHHPGETRATSRFAAAVMLGIAYATSVGGVATLVGSPPNAIFVGQAKALFPELPEVGFARWTAFALPLAAGFLAIVWAYLVFWVGRQSPGSPDMATPLTQWKGNTKPWTLGEALVFTVVALTALAWIWRADVTIGSLTILVWTTLAGLSDVHDGTIAIAAVIALFAIPVNWRRQEFLLDWDSAVRLSWGVLLLIGGGFALAEAFRASGLAAWVVSGMAGLQGLPTVLVVFVVCLAITFLSEVASNTALVALAVPVLGAAAVALGIHPYQVMIPAVVAASLAFMLPSETPPNAIVFGSGYVTIPQMARVGFALNLLAVLWTTLISMTLVRWVFGIN